jgi:glycosyltransferase involved in cell wall biosynthesis
MTKIILVANTDWYLFNFRLSLARYLRNQGWEVSFVSPAGRFVEKIEQQGFRWISWNLGRKTVAPWRELPSLLELGRIYRHEKADIIHHHTIKPVIYGSLAARLAGKPALVNSITGRGYVFIGDDERAALLRWMVKPLYKLALSLPNCALVFENENDRRYFIQQGLVPAQQTWLIEGVGVDEDIFSPLPEPVSEPVVLMAARLLWDKGVGVLVEAARLLHQRVQVRVVLVGSPDPGNPKSVDEVILRGWHEEGVIENWGWQDDMQQVYSRCHIVTLPTMYGEGVPTTLLEAAACARPLVATDIPGCRAIVEDGKNGFLVQPNDPQGLADAIERLVIDPQLRVKMGLAGRQLVVEKYTQLKINLATFSVYQTLLNSG